VKANLQPLAATGIQPIHFQEGWHPFIGGSGGDDDSHITKMKGKLGNFGIGKLGN
jgi:hypothetical protein